MEKALPGEGQAVSKPTLIFIGAKQFGYHTDAYKLARYLKESFDIIYICLDCNMEKIVIDGVDVRYVSGDGRSIVRLWRLIYFSLNVIRDYPFAFVFLIYFPLCSFVSILSRRKIVVDFRSGSVAALKLVRSLRDILSTVESRFFSRVSVISLGLAKTLHIQKKKMFILPLGSDIISSKPKLFDSPRLFYIGTFGNRNLHHVFLGLSMAIKEKPDLRAVISFDVVGFGYRGEERGLRKLVGDLGLQGIVRFHGRLSHDDAKMFFDKSNIGISYVPITDYYDHQPPTKTYEYILSGIPVIATATSENARLISSVNGVLCQDTPDSFANALLICISKFPEYESEVIRATLSGATWENIASNFRSQILNGG